MKVFPGPGVPANPFWIAMDLFTCVASQPAGSYGEVLRSTLPSRVSCAVQVPPVTEALLQEVASFPVTGSITGSSKKVSESASYSSGT